MNVRLPSCDGLQTIEITDGVVTSISHSRQDDASAINGGEMLALPAFVDGHVHLDKTFLGGPWVPHQGSSDVGSRIATEKRLRRQHVEDFPRRAEHLARQMLGFGTTALRTHIDIDEEARLSGIDMALELRERLGDLMDIQIVAFPQSGLWASETVVPDLDEALRRGVDVVGGVDPTVIDRDPTASLDVIFGLADRHGVGVDLHLHEPGETGAAVIRGMCERTRALAMTGKVVVSHGFCLRDLPEDRLDDLGEAMAGAGVALMTSAPGDGPLVPVARLARLGVDVFTASDNIRDAWAPFGNGDMLDRAGRLAWRADMRHDEQLRFALDCATGEPARILGFAPRSLKVGHQADFVLVPSPSVEEAVCNPPAQRRVFRKGREVA